jgi:hypothetical protein
MALPSTAFKKGERPIGRAKGTPNKVTKNTKELIANIVDKLAENYLEDIEAMKPSERMDMLSKLLEYIVPKLGRIDSVVENVNTVPQVLRIEFVGEE